MEYPLQLVIFVSTCGLIHWDKVIMETQTIHIITVHVLNILDQILLSLLAVTTIVNLVKMEHKVMDCTLTIHYGMDQAVHLKTVVVMMPECHGSSVNFLQL